MAPGGRVMGVYAMLDVEFALSVKLLITACIICQFCRVRHERCVYEMQLNS